jgi:hypothetical protein
MAISISNIMPNFTTAMSQNATQNPKLRLLNTLMRDQTAIATFMLLKGVRAAQIVSRTGLDVRFSQY